MTKPVCPNCQMFYRPHKNGTPFIEMMPIGEGQAPPGTAAPERWAPYKLWMGDLWRCRGCGSEIIVGVAMNPLSEHYRPDFAAEVARVRATIKINDC